MDSDSLAKVTVEIIETLEKNKCTVEDSEFILKYAQRVITKSTTVQTQGNFYQLVRDGLA